MTSTRHFRVIAAVYLITILLASPTLAFADTGEDGGLFTGTTLVEVGLLLLVSACALTAFKIYGSVRGGRIAECWRWFVLGFAMLGIAQLAVLISQMGLVIVSDFWVGILRLASLLVVFMGAARMRKLLA